MCNKFTLRYCNALWMTIDLMGDCNECGGVEGYVSLPNPAWFPIRWEPMVWVDGIIPRVM